MQRKRAASYIRYIASLLLFGSNGAIASRIALSSWEIVLLRTLLGSLLLLLLFLLGRNRFSFYRRPRQFACLCLSGAAMGAGWIFLYEAYDRVGVSIASLLYYCGPVIVMALSPLLFGERLTRGRVLGFAAVLCGICLVNGGASGRADGFGLLCGGISALMYALMVILNKRAREICGLENALFQLLASFCTVALFTLFRQGMAVALPAASLAPMLLLGLVNTGLGCWLYFSSIGRLPAQSVAVCGYLEPLSALLFSILLLGERLQPLQIPGAILVLGGAVLAELLPA